MTDSPSYPETAVDPALTPKEFVDGILSACDASNWDADRNTGDYFNGLRDAYEAIHEIASEYQTAMYAWTRTSAPAQRQPSRDEIAAIIRDKVDYFLADTQGPLDAADAILALSSTARAILPGHDETMANLDALTIKSTDPRCTCAAIVNPNIPHARTCPLSSPNRGSQS